ncbi:unnamed protein product [Fraxinus pennsylvanica]|uniref:Protein kinase domain-containing protein n=1 Tax=Fraxinus pennsylvanica TaxID=56036 RepID=A0AAD2A961_9LAMI|nr:unnamed protein product [Fraxinus pennsylvanica]
MRDGWGNYFSSIFQQRSILVKKLDRVDASLAVNDMVFTVLMNHHKNVMKVFGCCLDLKFPAIIYEIDMINCKLLRDLLRRKKERDNIGDLSTKSIVIDNNGVAKLVDFSLCIALPPGESQVEVELAGTTGYIEPDYWTTGVITEKSDAFSRLALRCTVERRADRPDIIDVAKELVRIQRSVHPI